MKQRAHGYIAARAVVMLDQDPETKPFARLLIPHLGQAAVGAWLPDQTFFKDGVGSTQNHVLKMMPYRGEDAAYFKMPQQKLFKSLEGRKAVALLSKAQYATRLPEGYWDMAFRGECHRGAHVANCASALANTLEDMLTLGDDTVQDLLRRKPPRGVPEAVRARPEQIALYAFMLSHFPADAHMPSHTDGRPLGSYKAPLHQQWEKHLDEVVAAFPDQKTITADEPDALLAKAKGAVKLNLPAEIPALGAKDIWTYAVTACRGSFALSCVAAPPKDFPFDGNDTPSFQDIFGGADGKEMLDDMTQAILTDAVIDVAMIWKNAWRSVVGK